MRVLLTGLAVSGMFVAVILTTLRSSEITEELYINDAGDVCTVYQVNDRAIGIECEKEASER